MDYDVIIGLEVHAQLKTRTKLFCCCSTEFGTEPNIHTCPVCLGLPGVLPVINKKAVEFVLKTGLALNCKISDTSIFSRKNYYYPDLPKNYQISQYDKPLCVDGFIEINNKKIRIRRIHLEEDAGKLLHDMEGNTLVDLNRTGVPLMEIVTEPDISSPDEAYLYLTKLRSILRYLDVCDGNMEEGSLRCEPNISLKKRGGKEFGIKVELKNLNSFKAVKIGLEYEIERQTELLESGEKIIQETRRFDEKTSSTISMRGKEEAQDYRYFPEPDLVPILASSELKEEIKNSISELPDEKFLRFVKEYQLPEYDAAILTEEKERANFYEECVKFYNNPKIVSNWIMGELLRFLNLNNQEISESKITPKNLSDLLKLIDKGTISGKIAKTVFEEMFKTGNSAEEIIKEKGLVQISDEGEIGKVVDEVINENPKVVQDFKGGKDKSLGFLVGQVMKKTKGQANPQLVNKLLKEKILG